MRRKSLALTIALPALLGLAALPAGADAGIRVCTTDDGNGTQVNQWTFTGGLAGTWTAVIRDRTCIGHAGAPADFNLSGTYLGNPCVYAVLLFGSTGTGYIAGGTQGETHSGPASNNTYVSIDSTHVFSGFCNILGTSSTLSASTVETHVIGPNHP